MKKNRSFFPLVVVTMLLLVGLLVGPLGYKRVKRWQAQRIYNEARQAEENGNLTLALEKAQASHRLQPGNHAALMYLARLSLRTPETHPEMFRWWEEAMRTPDCQTDDILQYLQVLVQHHDMARAYPLVVSLRQLDPDNEEAANIQAELLLRERKLAEAERILSEFVTRHPDALPTTYQRLTQILLGFASDQRQEQAEALLLKLADTSGEPQLFALRRITVDPHFNADQQADAAEKLLALPGITIADHLTAYNALLQDRRMRRTDIRDHLVELLKDESQRDPDALARIGAWLINSDQSRYFLQLLTLDEARVDTNLFAARLMAMVRNNQAEEVYAMTFEHSDENPLNPVENLLIRAEALAQLGRTDEFQTTLTAIADSADSSNFRLIEQRLVGYGAWEPLLSIYDRFRADERTQALARRKQLIAYYFLGRERELLNLLADFDGYLAEEEPPTQALICYLNALYGREHDETVETAEALVTRYPNIIDFRIVLAFQAFKDGQRQRVENLVGNLPSLPRDRQRFLQIAMTVLRSALGKPPSGDLPAIDPLEENILPAERVLLQAL